MSIINRLIIFCLSLLAFLVHSQEASSQDHSIAHEWNEELLEAIRNDFARPTVHARNLWHSSVLMYDIWSYYNENEADTYFLGKTVDGFSCPIDENAIKFFDKDIAIDVAISYAMYRLISHRFALAPDVTVIQEAIDNKMLELGYDISITTEIYADGNPAGLGNHIAAQMIQFGFQDGSNEVNEYGNLFYEPVNAPLVIKNPGAGIINDPNRWQPLTLDLFIDQSGNPIPFNTPEFLSPEWGEVTPFAMDADDLTILSRDGNDYKIYHDPGLPPQVDLNNSTISSEEFLWGNSLVSIWGSHLDPRDGVRIDISPASLGNIDDLPESIADYPDFYKYIEGGDASVGHVLNPATGQKYDSNIVLRADYARVLAEFWADGPDSETPPGHWFTLLNYVSDHPELEKKYRGVGETLDDLEWDVKSYFMLGGAMHDCAISAWGIKGYYDYLRPVSAIRAMADRGQSSDPTLPNYNVAGFPLRNGFIELVNEGDPLAGENNVNAGKVKLYTWRGPDFIFDEEFDIAGVDWILAENWYPYQRPSFVTPPFAGYVSGHSTYSRAAADVLAYITGSEFFPGGIAEFVAPKDEFLVFEDGPSEDIVLQWATYRDASDQTSLSRIWGGIHPPADDIPGRRIGIEIAKDVTRLSNSIFYIDADSDRFFSYEDCDDNDASINPDRQEICDGIDNDCNGLIDDGLQLYTYYLDFDNDGYGDAAFPVDTCRSSPISGYVVNRNDCNDSDMMINPLIAEVCDGIDNNCNGIADDGLLRNRYYFDFDVDGFGEINSYIDTCLSISPIGFVKDSTDCNDNDRLINPMSVDIAENAIDEDCNGVDLYTVSKIFPNPFMTTATVHYNTDEPVSIFIYDYAGKLVYSKLEQINLNAFTLEMSHFVMGLYWFQIRDMDDSILYTEKIVKSI